MFERVRYSRYVETFVGAFIVTLAVCAGVVVTLALLLGIAALADLITGVA